MKSIYTIFSCTAFQIQYGSLHTLLTCQELTPPPTPQKRNKSFCSQLTLVACNSYPAVVTLAQEAWIAGDKHGGADATVDTRITDAGIHHCKRIHTSQQQCSVLGFKLDDTYKAIRHRAGKIFMTQVLCSSFEGSYRILYSFCVKYCNASLVLYTMVTLLQCSILRCDIG